MGTLGGKVGYGVGMLSVALLAVPVVHLIPGACFFEGGCGEEEQTGLIVAALILLGLGLLSGAIAKRLFNYLLQRTTRSAGS